MKVFGALIILLFLITSVGAYKSVQIKSLAYDLHFRDTLTDFNQGVYDADDFPVILADGVIEDHDGEEYPFEQAITVPAAKVGFGQDDD